MDLIVNVQYQGMCLHCGATSGYPRPSKESAIKAWNTRADGWISVEDRLPEVDGYYMTAPKLGPIHVDLYCSIDENFYDAFVYDYEITHWMPLPAPPNTVVDAKANKCHFCGKELDDGYLRCYDCRYAG